MLTHSVKKFLFVVGYTPLICNMYDSDTYKIVTLSLVCNPPLQFTAKKNLRDNIFNAKVVYVYISLPSKLKTFVAVSPENNHKTIKSVAKYL